MRIRGALSRQFARVRQYKLRRTLPSQERLLRQLRSRDRWLLVVLDAGRYDYLAPLIGDRYDADIYRTFSAARDTFEWVSTQWVDDVDDVTYLSAMTPIDDERPDFDIEAFNDLYETDAFVDELGEIVPLWRDEWDAGVGSVPPGRVTDRALDYMNRDKLVVHYVQPHSPFIGSPRLLGHTDNESALPKEGQPVDKPIWARVRDGTVDDHLLRMAYQGNADRVIRALRPLVDERDGDVVVTADHGEALGEYGAYAHGREPHPKRREVPWAKIKSVRRPAEGGTGPADREDQMEALGYL